MIGHAECFTAILDAVASRLVAAAPNEQHGFDQTTVISTNACTSTTVQAEE